MMSQRILNQETIPDSYQARSGAQKHRDTIKPESEIESNKKLNDFIEPIHKTIALKEGVTYSKRNERSLQKYDSQASYMLLSEDQSYSKLFNSH